MDGLNANFVSSYTFVIVTLTHLHLTG